LKRILKTNKKTRKEKEKNKKIYKRPRASQLAQARKAGLAQQLARTRKGTRLPSLSH
jgi:hypothetical protein